MKGLRKFLALFLLLPLLLGAIQPAKYSTLSDVQFSMTEQLEGVTIYRPVGSTYDSEFVESSMKRAERYINRFAAIKGLPTDSCQERELGIFVVDSSVINDLERYPYTTNQVSTRWALYDPYSSDYDYSAIVLTDRRENYIDDILLVHELGHYWHDVCGWRNDWDGDSENFALAFQDYYTLDRYGRRF